MSPEEKRLNEMLDAQAPKLEPQMTTEEKTIRMAIRGFVTILVTGMVIVGGCTAHSNSYDAERSAEDVKLLAEKTKMAIANADAEKAKIESMERMIKDGANPVAIRCMIMGWDDDSACLTIGLHLGKELPTE